MKIFVAGEQFDVVAEVASNYVKKRWKTAKEFDLNAGTYDEVSEKLIKSTRVFSSRISKVECEWFIERALTAPWTSVKPGDCLSAADPMEHGGIYDKALELWSHFTRDPRVGVADAKISRYRSFKVEFA